MPINPPFANGFGEMAGCKANGLSVKNAPKTAGESKDDEIGFLSMIVQMVNDGAISLPAGLDGSVISDMISHLNSDQSPISKETQSDLLRLLKQEGTKNALSQGDTALGFKKPASGIMPGTALETVAGDAIGEDDALKIVIADSTDGKMPDDDGQMKLAETPNPKIAAAETSPDREVRATRPIDSSILDQIGKAFIRNDNGRSEIRLSLRPPELGHLRMSIVTQDNHVTVKIITEAPMVKEIIDNNLDQLRADLGSRGLEIENFDVSVSQDHAQNGHDFDTSVFAQTEDRRAGDKSRQDMPDGMSPIRDIVGKTGADNGRINYFA